MGNFRERESILLLLEKRGGKTVRVISVLAVRSRRVDEKLEDSRELRPLILNYYHPRASTV